MRIEQVAGFAGMCLLVGCGGSSSSSGVETFSAQTVTIGVPGAATYNESDDTIRVTSRTYNNRNESFLPDEINSYKTSANVFPVSEFAVRGVTPSGQGTAISYLAADGTVERIGETTSAPTGTIVYLGDYVGLFSSDAANIDAGAAYVLGDVRLNADFSNSDVNVRIENRRGAAGTSSHLDLSLRAPIGDNGTFSSQRGGTDSQDGRLNEHIIFGSSEERQINGMFTGTSGEEAIGTVNFSYRHGSTGSLFYEENGVFVVTQ